MQFIKEMISQYRNDREKIKTLATQQFLKYYEIKYDRPFTQTKEMIQWVDIDEYENQVRIETSESSGCGCCGDEEYHYLFPIEYLWSETWEEELKEKIAEDKRKEEEKQMKREKEKQKQAQKSELQLLAKLKAKYENDNKT